MSKTPKKVEVTEVGTRDGFQAEKKFIPTEDKVRFINRLIDAGVPRIEFSSFVSPKAVPQLVDVVDVLAGLDRTKGTTLGALVPNKRGALRAAEAKIDEMIVFMSASESHNKKNVNRTVDESLEGFEEVVKVADQARIPVVGAIATAFGCPFEGEVPMEQVGMIAKRYRDMGMKAYSLGDTTGMATPPIVRDLVRYLQDQVPEIPVGLHFHNTRGIGLCNVMAGLEEGVEHYESSFGGIGGCPFAPGATGNICTEDLLYLLHEMGIETGIDLQKLCAIARDVECVVEHDLPGQLMKAGPRLQLHDMEAVRTAVG